MRTEVFRTILLCLFLVISFFLALVFGSEPLSLPEIFTPHSSSARLFFELRLPRTILAFFVGGGLAVTGMIYQILFQNNLADPYLLGVSSATILGIAGAEVFLGATALSLTSISFGMSGALIVSGLLIALSLTRWGGSLERVALFGLGVNFVFSAMILLILSYMQQSTGGASLRFLFGQIPWVSGKEVSLLIGVTIPVLFALWAFGRKLDALSLGDGVARTLGVSVLSTRAWLIFISSIFLAVSTAFTGSIGFVGLVVPHVVRLWTTPSHTRSSLQRCFFIGGIFVLLADLGSRLLLPPLEFPIGVFTTLLGGPLFLFLLWRRT